MRSSYSHGDMPACYSDRTSSSKDGIGGTALAPLLSTFRAFFLPRSRVIGSNVGALTTALKRLALLNCPAFVGRLSPRRAVRLGGLLIVKHKRTPVIQQGAPTGFVGVTIFNKKSSGLREVEIPKTQAWF
jgi:hypothetical protein